MEGFLYLLQNFFTHKDHLNRDLLTGMLFTPLHFVIAGILLAAIIVGAILLSKRSERTIRRTFAILWACLTVVDIFRMIWESTTGNRVGFEWGGNLPLYPCSIFMYAMPFAIWGRGKVRYAACGYLCTLGFFGGVINFIYPVNVLTNYSSLSFAGLNTFIYHGAIVFCALVMLISGYHSFKKAKSPLDLLLPAIPALCVSVVAHLVNFSWINSDYMFFKMNSFFLPAIKGAISGFIGTELPIWGCVALVYVFYLVLHAAPYIPFFIINNVKSRKKAAA